jgi:hypothetical protein
VRLGIRDKASPQNEISLVYKLSKNHTPRREIIALLFSQKLGVFEPSITTPYGSQRR